MPKPTVNGLGSDALFTGTAADEAAPRPLSVLAGSEFVPDEAVPRRVPPLYRPSRCSRKPRTLGICAHAFSRDAGHFNEQGHAEWSTRYVRHNRPIVKDAWRGREALHATPTRTEAPLMPRTARSRQRTG